MSTKNGPLFIFPITLSKINRFRCFLVWEFLRQFDINSLYICPPYLYTVTTLPWEIQKTKTVIFLQYYSYRLQTITLSQKKHIATVVLQLICYTKCCLLLPIICVALFYCQFFISLVSHFQSHQCQPTTGSLQSLSLIHI